MTEEKFVYLFDEGSKELRNTLGGKGANLAEMKRLGLPIPTGFTITCQACLIYFEDKDLLEKIRPDILNALKEVEKETGKKFNDPDNPLLLSVRSGAPLSMPGMMDTVLNLGLNENIVNGLIKKTGNERFVLDSYRRFIQMFGDVVMGIDHEKWEHILSSYKSKIGPDAKDTDLTVEDLKGVIKEYKELYKKELGKDFPNEPIEQLFLAIEAVFSSWNIPRAKTYRKINKIPNFGTAVNVQTMVYGNMGNDSATGVAFTRNPATGEKKYFGEYLTNAQGEDVVAGIRTPKEIQEMEQEFPKAYKELVDIFIKLENHYTDVQDVEFTVEQGTLYMLQTRTGKRTTKAAIKIALDMMHEGLIDEKTVLTRIDPYKIDQLLHKRIDEDADVKEIAKGLAASPGAAIGQAVFTADDAEKWVNEDNKTVILCRPETKPDDIHGLVVAEGVITQHGGMTSHAAVVARGMGKPCVAGVESIKIDIEKKQIIVGDLVIKEGDIISMDGGTGKIYKGTVPLIEPEVSGDFDELLKISDKYRKLGVHANADTPLDAQNAINFGAEGIGLCRTEHMFMAQERLPVVQDMILAKNKDDLMKAVNEIEKMQTSDFYEILKEMEGKPVIIRLLDPPLHEFLPELENLLLETQKLKLTGGNEAEIKKNEALIREIRGMSESNPMLGLRGCRLGITRPEINEMQVRAIINAGVQLKKEGVDAKPKIMIPLIGTVNELKVIEPDLRSQAKEIIDKAGVTLDYEFGTMIEIPRAALTADEVAEVAEFFSFGTNDLTQMTFGYSRDDAEGKFLPQYLEANILKYSPFASIDEGGVGKLVEMAVKAGRKVRGDKMSIGVCGEHGGDPRSIDFFHRAGLDYVSCSPFRVPVARLAAAQAAIKHSK
ncbi:MAG: pyruvate, phosphate dikinase [Candidatus Hodarchaeota archaeon]